MDLLTNAVESIQLGVEDFRRGSRPRLLSAVRNIHAGILLLYKEALRRMSPVDSEEVLLKSKVVPKRDGTGIIKFVGEGKKTVDVQQIKERFAHLGIATEWKRFDKITNIRNTIEHYYPKADQKALRGVIADAFIIARAFVATQLGANPRELLGENTWQTMLGVEEIYAAERKMCDEALNTVDWDSAALENGIRELTCPECGSDLLRPEGGSTQYNEITLCCRACGSEESPEQFVPKAIQASLAHDMHLAYADGAEIPYTTCPECGEEAYVMEEERCALCGEQAEHECAMCGNTILPEELVLSPYCGWCSHMMSKDD